MLHSQTPGRCAPECLVLCVGKSHFRAARGMKWPSHSFCCMFFPLNARFYAAKGTRNLPRALHRTNGKTQLEFFALEQKSIKSITLYLKAKVPLG